MTQKSLQILMVLHMPWDPNLGGPQTQIRLAEEFCKLGHRVEKFDYNDAFPYIKFLPTRLARLVMLFSKTFSAKAVSFIKVNCDRFDIIDAHQGNLPLSKQQLKFNGLLVTRSAGLYAFHQDFANSAKEKWKSNKVSNPLKNIVQFLENTKKEEEQKNYLPSLENADGIIVLNEDEYNYVKDNLNLGCKCKSISNGLTQGQHMSFSKFAQPSELRLRNKKVVFIGSWGIGKGSLDWAAIINKVKKEVPESNFMFLGTGCSAERVLNDLQTIPSDWVTIISQYKNEDLPNLLSHATVGAFPSYVEGFGIAVLEKLSSGLPTVAYDIPGPRTMLSLVDNSLMVPVGNVEQLSSRIVDILSMDAESYSSLSKKCIEVANQFSWDVIAEQTLKAYYEFLELKK